MNTEQIDTAIQNHLRWVADFNTALAGTGVSDFDLNMVCDDKACALGKWFSTAESQELLGKELHARAIAVHGTFHEISAEVISSLRTNAPPK
jgi:hypothetical protein